MVETADLPPSVQQAIKEAPSAEGTVAERFGPGGTRTTARTGGVSRSLKESERRRTRTFRDPRTGKILRQQLTDAELSAKITNLQRLAKEEAAAKLGVIEELGKEIPVQKIPSAEDRFSRTLQEREQVRGRPISVPLPEVQASRVRRQLATREIQQTTPAPSFQPEVEIEGRFTPATATITAAPIATPRAFTKPSEFISTGKLTPASFREFGFAKSAEGSLLAFPLIAGGVAIETLATPIVTTFTKGPAKAIENIIFGTAKAFLRPAEVLRGRTPTERVAEVVGIVAAGRVIGAGTKGVGRLSRIRGRQVGAAKLKALAKRDVAKGQPAPPISRVRTQQTLTRPLESGTEVPIIRSGIPTRPVVKIVTTAKGKLGVVRFPTRQQIAAPIKKPFTEQFARTGKIFEERVQVTRPIGQTTIPPEAFLGTKGIITFKSRVPLPRPRFPTPTPPTSQITLARFQTGRAVLSPRGIRVVKGSDFFFRKLLGSRKGQVGLTTQLERPVTILEPSVTTTGIGSALITEPLIGRVIPIVSVRERERTAQRQIVSVFPIISTETAIEPISDVAVEERARAVQEVTPEPIIRTGTTQRQETQQQQEQQQTQPITTFPEIEIPVDEIIVPPETITIPRTPTPIRIAPDDKRRPTFGGITTPRLKPSFHAQIKEKGRFFQATKKPLPFNKAHNFARNVVDNSAAATYKIVKAKKRTKERDDPNILLIRKFIRKNGTFQELNTFRIDSPGERAEITARGLLALRRKAARSRAIGRLRSSALVLSPNRVGRSSRLGVRGGVSFIKGGTGGFF